ncbi:MAG: ATP-binding cassette domain-containing protein [Micromonosporaceae bacterium]
MTERSIGSLRGTGASARDRAAGIRYAVSFGLALAALATLSLYRETIGFPLFYLALLTTVLFWITQATSWNILSGYSGYFSFGQAAYVGVGAYTTAVLFGRHQVNFYLTLVVSAALCALLALAVGALAFRLRSLRGEIFALLTLAVPFILAALARIRPEIDGGQGVVVPIPPFPAELGRFQDFLYLINLLVAGAALAVAFTMQRSRAGWALAAIRDAEDVAEGLGVATFRYKLQALVTSGVIGGVGGSVFALQIGFVAVESVFNLTIPLFVIVMSVLGGRTHWFGPVIGVAFIVLLQDRLTASGLGNWQLIALGVVLAALVIIAPDGLLARLRARPAPVLAAFALVTAALWAPMIPAEPLDAILAGMLAATVVALWPARRRAGVQTTGAGAAGVATAATAGDQESVAAETVGASAAAAPPSVAAGPPESVASGESVARAKAVSPAAEPGEVLVECRGVARYFGGVRALEDVTLTIREGELVGLVGPNGSGKTTLVGMLSGTLRPTRGSIRVGGLEITGLPPHRVAHVGVARTYQIPRPFASMTVRDNVAMAIMFGRSPEPLAAARRDAQRHLEVVGLDSLADAYPSALNLHQRQLLGARSGPTGWSRR